MMTVINIRKNPEYVSRGIAYFQEQWATEQSKAVYTDCITRSVAAKNPLPVWYLLVDEAGEIAGCAGLITNDFISCGDLWPWLCALYVGEAHRGRGLGGLLIGHIRADAAKMGFSHLYLCTDLDGYYEKYGFAYLCDGHHPWGGRSRVYGCATGAAGAADAAGCAAQGGPSVQLCTPGDAISVKKPNGTDVEYYIFDEFEIHRNVITPGAAQEWHRHRVIDETYVVTAGEVTFRWVEDGRRQAAALREGDVLRAKKSIHTIENNSGENAEFIVFRMVPDGISKKEIIKKDKEIVEEKELPPGL